MSEPLELPTCNCHAKPNQVCDICQIWVPYVNNQQSQLKILAEALLTLDDQWGLLILTDEQVQAIQIHRQLAREIMEVGNDTSRRR